MNQLTQEIIKREALRLMTPDIARRVRAEFVASDVEGETNFDVYDPTSNKGLTVHVSAEDCSLSLDDYSDRVLKPSIAAFHRAIGEAA
jgi:hypothetical protein